MSEKLKMAAAFITNLDGGFARNGKEVHDNPIDKLIFQKIIKNRAVLVGRKTYETLPPIVRSLPKCWFILSRQREFMEPLSMISDDSHEKLPQQKYIKSLDDLDIYSEHQLIKEKGLVCIGGASVLEQVFSDGRLEFAYMTICDWYNSDDVEISLSTALMDHLIMSMQNITSIDGGGHIMHDITETVIDPETRVIHRRILSFDQLVNLEEDEETKKALVKKYRIM